MDLVGAREAIRLRPVITKDEIDAWLDVLSVRLNDHYGAEPLLAVGVLKGAIFFFCDLVRRLKMPLMIDFVQLASYGLGTTSMGRVRFLKDLDLSIAGENVLVVDDIVDSGRSLAFLIGVLAARHPKSLASCVLIDKYERREVEFQADFSGFRLDKGYVVGYGMDCAERYRELDGIFELDEF
ncbi:Hypoxanthine phosphoribosyltransferase [Desulfovibrionales bacterium]